MHVHTADRSVLSLGFGGHTCSRGVHMCCLYETEAEREEVLYGFVHQGDVEGDLLLVGHTEATCDRFVEAYATRFPHEADHPRDPQRFALLSTERMYHPNGAFHPEELDVIWKGLRDRAAAAGRHARATAEMDWALREVQGRELVVPYEARIDPIFERGGMAAICFYDLRRFPGATIMGVLQTHRFTIARGRIVENPYYDPGAWLAEHAPGLPPFVV